MSKEKNLVYVGPHKNNVINGRHCDVFERRDRGDYECHIAGPAIDRLYAFEKLMMEPEEIEDMIRRQAKIMSAKIHAESENKLLAKVNRDLTDSHLKLIGKNENQAKTIRGLTEENDELRKECAERERNEERLHTVIKNQNELIDELKGNSIPGMTCKQVISQQRERIRELDRICGVQKEVIDARDKTIKSLEEHFNTMQFRNDNQYRSLQAMRNEINELRSMNQRQYDNIAELQKENETLKHAIDKIRIDAELAETHTQLSK